LCCFLVLIRQVDSLLNVASRRVQQLLRLVSIAPEHRDHEADLFLSSSVIVSSATSL
jgi:hypothetical protein